MSVIFGRVNYNGQIFHGIVELEKRTFRIISGTYLGKYELTSEILPIDDNLKFLPPTEPTKIISLGLNYIDHAKELSMPIPSEPIIFLKPSTAVIGDKENIIYPPNVKQLDYEAELAVVIKDKIKNIYEEDVENHILGYTCFNDVTARDLQKKDVQWTRAKSFDTFAPIGPYIVSGIKPNNLSIQTILNHKVVQNSNTKNMIFSVEYVVSFVSKIMTLNPGDIISLGTPPGVGPMFRGDTVIIKIENIGELTNYVV